MLNFKGFPYIGPILFGLSLFLKYNDYSSSGVVEIAEHDDGFDVLFVDHLPKLCHSLRGWGLGEDGEVLAVDCGFHVAGVAVEIARAAAFDSTVIVFS